jgi:SAM-dependent methyltransferase
MGVYGAPLYYEIAFGFVDAGKQVDLFEQFIRKYSGRPARRFLDIGCGPGLQLREIARRGYEAVGLDASPRMLRYLEGRAAAEGLRIRTVRADMADFRLRPKADFASLMMGTVTCLDDGDSVLSHLDSVARSLGSGGLYVIDRFGLDWANPDFFRPGRWTARRDGIRVRAAYGLTLKEAMTQTVTDLLRLEVTDRGRRIVLEERRDRKLIFPQEFLTLIRMNGRFDFLGWFEHDGVGRLKTASMDNLAILRRR